MSLRRRLRNGNLLNGESVDVLRTGFFLLIYLGLLIKPMTSDRRCPRDAPSDTNCDFRNQRINTVTDVDIPSQCQSLDLSYNLLPSVEDSAFVRLRGLLSLDLSHNQINRLGPKSFSGLFNLACLDLSNNPLQYAAYPTQVFRPLRRLTILYIVGCTSTVDVYPDLALSTLSSLEELYMDMCMDVKFGPGFASLYSLKTLSANRLFCDIHNIYNETFKVFENLTVTTLNLAHCELKDIAKMSFSHFRHLKNFNIAGKGGHKGPGIGAAMESLSAFSGRNLTSINISKQNNRTAPISDLMLTKDKFRYLTDICVESLDLSDNKVIYLDANVFRMFRHPECLKDLRFNNFYLQSYVLDEVYSLINSFTNLRYFEVTGNLLADNGHDKGNVNTGAHTSRNRTVRFPSKLEFLNISHVQLSCRHEPRVSIVGGHNIHTLDISYTESESCFQSRITGAENVRVLNISGNDGIFLRPETVDSFPNLRTLVARDTNFAIIFKEKSAGSLFRSLTRLQNLDLANSGIISLPEGMLVNTPDLLTLSLDHNKLSTLPTFIYSLEKLNQVDMRFNVLSSIPLCDRQELDRMAMGRTNFLLLLEGNPFTCNCETYDFVEWIWSSNVQFDNHGNYSCIMNNGSFVPMLNLHSTLKYLKRQCISSFWVVFGALGVSVLLVCLLGTAVGYRYRVPLKYWCITLCKKPEAKPKKRHKYDALVAYCHEDKQWVCHTLQPILEKNENQFGYKLCLYDRDFVPGVSIDENVVTAINSSFKTILVITPAFVRSAWCHFEIEMARMKMIHEGRQDVIIPVILQDVPVSAMPKALLNMWNTSVFLVWSESPAEQRHFWDKLTSALGSVRVCRHSVYREDEPGGNDREMESVLNRGERCTLLS